MENIIETHPNVPASVPRLITHMEGNDTLTSNVAVNDPFGMYVATKHNRLLVGSLAYARIFRSQANVPHSQEVPFEISLNQPLIVCDCGPMPTIVTFVAAKYTDETSLVYLPIGGIVLIKSTVPFETPSPDRSVSKDDFCYLWMLGNLWESIKSIFVGRA